MDFQELTPDNIAELLGTVPESLQIRVEAEITRCLRKVADYYDSDGHVPLVRPVVVYDLKGTTAGYGGRSQGVWRIRINSEILVKNTEHYLATTLPHEVAHVVQYQMYPQSKPHGDHWRHIMHILGVEPNRCHNYETTKARVHPRPFIYQCSCREHHLTARKHSNILRGERYYCRTCKSTLYFKQHTEGGENA